MYCRLQARGELTSYSKDSILGEIACSEEYTPEFLHSLDPTGMPPHALCLRPGTLVILLRNYAPNKGMCNRTRAVVKPLAEDLAGFKELTPVVEFAWVNFRLSCLLGHRNICEAD